MHLHTSTLSPFLVTTLLWSLIHLPTFSSLCLHILDLPLHLLPSTRTTWRADPHPSPLLRPAIPTPRLSPSPSTLPRSKKSRFRHANSSLGMFYSGIILPKMVRFQASKRTREQEEDNRALLPPVMEESSLVYLSADDLGPRMIKSRWIEDHERSMINEI